MDKISNIVHDSISSIIMPEKYSYKEAKKIEQWGLGVKRAIRLCESVGLIKPEIIETGLFIKFIFYRTLGVNDKTGRKLDANDKTGRKLHANDKTGRKLHANDKTILDYISINGDINTSKGVELLRLSKSSVSKIFKEMVEKKLLIRIGESRSTKYMLGDKNE